MTQKREQANKAKMRAAAFRRRNEKHQTKAGREVSRFRRYFEDYPVFPSLW